MSEPDHQATDTLLPSASISVFSRDADTLQSTGALADDWRFARVAVNSHEGDVETAISTFQSEGSTDLVIIQTEDIDDGFTERLGALSEHCDENTAAIIVGPVNDVYLYRKLIEMGVSDYLVRPITPDILSEVIAKSLIERLGVSDSRLVAFVGAKGGVGTSSIVQICSWMASEKMGQKTALLDAAGGWSPISVGMGFDPSATLFEIARAVDANNEDALERVFFQAGNKLTILASGSDSMLDPSISAAQFESILDNLMVKFPVVFADLSCAEASVKKATLARAHHIVLVTEPTVTSLRFCRSLLKEMSVVRGGDTDDVSLIVNNTGLSKAYEVGHNDIEEALEFKPAAFIPHDPSIFLKHESQSHGVLSDKESGGLLSALLPVLQKTISGDFNVADEGQGGNSGLLGGFLSKMAK